MTKIHPTAIVSKTAKISSNVEIGAFCVIGDEVEIGENSILKSHIVVEGDTKIGKNNTIFPFAVIGVIPQDLKFRGEKSQLIIGDNNIIREHVTIHLGTFDGAMRTVIGNNCLFMVGAHIAHDCIVGNNVILANNATLAGHVEVGNDVIIGGLSAVHQFVRIGFGAMIGGMSGVEHDVIPNGLVMGERAHLAGLNLVGMKRRGVEREEIHALRAFYKDLFSSENLDEQFSKRVENLAKNNDKKSVQEIAEFVKGNSSRSFCQVK